MSMAIYRTPPTNIASRDTGGSTLPPGFSIDRSDGRTYLILTTGSTSETPDNFVVHYKVGKEWRIASTDPNIVLGGGRGGFTKRKVSLGADIPAGMQLEMAIGLRKPDGSTEWLNKGFGKNFFVST